MASPTKNQWVFLWIPVAFLAAAVIWLSILVSGSSSDSSGSCAKCNSCCPDASSGGGYDKCDSCCPADNCPTCKDGTVGNCMCTCDTDNYKDCTAADCPWTYQSYTCPPCPNADKGCVLPSTVYTTTGGPPIDSSGPLTDNNPSTDNQFAVLMGDIPNPYG